MDIQTWYSKLSAKGLNSMLPYSILIQTPKEQTFTARVISSTTEFKIK